eukprot:CAMPEP_0202910756 /NCGR_PEP_ID=MMETSP1392-20130828/52949_1 /ASSEMBLY_ACC=CAM_ASM_000868 /TAXON_ID=225041 /ORGANISM="Chlamydomonas chlamydogama, Strain SAG 11-48b" /LENGTH=74 /DNA_ID=CAMNT_0049600971 /DNA_START=270 /DNA_END=494 /DNA_ORIENTATION=-
MPGPLPPRTVGGFVMKRVSAASTPDSWARSPSFWAAVMEPPVTNAAAAAVLGLVAMWPRSSMFWMQASTLMKSL